MPFEVVYYSFVSFKTELTPSQGEDGIMCWKVFGLKTGSESTGQARDHLPIYKLDLADPIFGIPEL